MPVLDLAALAAYRAQTYRLNAPLRSPEEAAAWLNERRFVYFWPIKDTPLPSLWAAVAGDRPVADAHDDPGHITWGWKDAALGKRVWYYAKILRRKATLIAPDFAAAFYALSDNYGDPDEDVLLAYRAGRLTLAAKQIYETLLEQGALNTPELRRQAHLTGAAAQTEFSRALEVLQADFKILPVGVADVGGWHYSFIYDLTARHWPDLSEQARALSETEARRRLLAAYFASVGAARLSEVQRLFGWPAPLTRRAVDGLLNAGQLSAGWTLAGQAGEWLALPLFGNFSPPPA
ncbi:MAG: hypothetical protein OHK0031_01200 [Anaerolineales bacterium]